MQSVNGAYSLPLVAPYLIDSLLRVMPFLPFKMRVVVDFMSHGCLSIQQHR